MGADSRARVADALRRVDTMELMLDTARALIHEGGAEELIAAGALLTAAEAHIARDRKEIAITS